MKNKILLSAAILAATSTTIFAASETFQAAVTAFDEPSISQGQALNFGVIRLAAGSTCTMTKTGDVTGQCNGVGNSAGTINVTGLAPSTAMTITVTGSNSTGDLTFVASAEATDSAGLNSGTIADSVGQNITTSAGGEQIDIAVFGVLTVDNNLNSGQSYSTDYTVDVSFQ
jgi:hypothetical protein